MSSSYSCCDMGLFDFFRRSSRSRSKTTEAATQSTVSEVSIDEDSRYSLPPTSSSSSSVLNKEPAPTLASSSLDSCATTASVDSSVDDADSSEPTPTTNESLGSIHNYDIVRELGRGATAVVQLGKQKDGDQLVALKVFKTSLLKKMREVKRVGRRMVVSTALDKVQVEIAIMKKLRHRNLLNLLEVYDDDTETLVLLLEYAPHGQIMHWDASERVYRASANGNGNGVFDEPTLRDCVRQLLLGLEYLHSNAICHRDLKPENILLGADGVYKIADFGVAHLFEDEEKETPTPTTENNNAPPSSGKKRGIVSSTAGTYAFMGPETLKGGAYSAYDADVWALGITIYALAFGKIPYYHQDVVELFEMIETQPLDLGEGDNNQSAISEGLAVLLRGMLQKDPEQRWSIQQCKEHAWLHGDLDDAAKTAFLTVHNDQVTVSEEEVARAVTKVTSMNVLLRVQLGANKWKRKAIKSLEMKKRASLTSQPTIDEDGERLSATGERSSFAKASADKPATAQQQDNQLEL